MTCITEKYNTELTSLTYSGIFTLLRNVFYVPFQQKAFDPYLHVYIYIYLEICDPLFNAFFYHFDRCY